MDKIVIMKNIKKNYSEKTVLKNINFTIAQNEIFGLLGPSGSGKTTIINILTGQSKKTSGEAKVFGVNTDSLTDDIYSSIGMVLDTAGLFERLTCHQNLVIYADIYKINKKEIPKVLAKVNLTNDTKTKVYKLSKGMKQRLLIARAIFHKPKLLFLDEPTNGLDPLNVLEIHNLILSLRNQGTTIFLTTHKMDEAMKLCDNIALLDNGVIMEYGVPDELCRKYNLENTLNILLKDGSKITLPNNPKSTSIINEYFKNGQVETIHSSEPDLENVFLSVTNREDVE